MCGNNDWHAVCFWIVYENIFCFADFQFSVPDALPPGLGPGNAATADLGAPGYQQYGALSSPGCRAGVWPGTTSAARLRWPHGDPSRSGGPGRHLDIRLAYT